MSEHTRRDDVVGEEVPVGVEDRDGRAPGAGLRRQREARRGRGEARSRAEVDEPGAHSDGGVGARGRHDQIQDAVAVHVVEERGELVRPRRAGDLAAQRREGGGGGVHHRQEARTTWATSRSRRRRSASSPFRRPVTEHRYPAAGRSSRWCRSAAVCRSSNTPRTRARVRRIRGEARESLDHDASRATEQTHGWPGRARCYGPPMSKRAAPVFAVKTIDELAIDDERSFRHVALYADLKEILRRDRYTFRVLPRRLAGRWDRALFLNLTFWGSGTGGDVLESDRIPADVVAHAAWHHLAAQAFTSSPGTPQSAEALFLGEAIASAFDVYLAGRLLGHAPRARRSSSPRSLRWRRPPTPRGSRKRGSRPCWAPSPPIPIEPSRTSVRSSSTRPAPSPRADGADEALVALASFEEHRFASLLHRHELSNWVLYARAYANAAPAPTNEHAPSTAPYARQASSRPTGSRRTGSRRRWRDAFCATSEGWIAWLGRRAEHTVRKIDADSGVARARGERRAGSAPRQRAGGAAGGRRHGERLPLPRLGRPANRHDAHPASHARRGRHPHRRGRRPLRRVRELGAEEGSAHSASRADAPPRMGIAARSASTSTTRAGSPGRCGSPSSWARRGTTGATSGWTGWRGVKNRGWGSS